jgi:hypothetical protein
MALGDSVEVDSGSFTPESLRLRRRLAETMLQQGMQTGPIGHWSQGLNRILQAMLGGYQVGELERREKDQEKSANEAILGLLGPAPTTGAPQGAAAPNVAPEQSGTGGTSFLGEVGPSTQPDSSVAPYARAISSIESGGEKDPYRAVGPATRTGDRAYGKYQVMGANVPSWTKEILGREMTPQQFLAEPQAQEAVFAGKFGQYLKQTGSPQDAASMWFTGRPASEGANRRAADPSGRPYGPTGGGYVEQFNRALGADAGGATPTRVAEAPGATASDATPSAAPAMPSVDPRTRAQIGRLLANPATRQLGMAMVQQIALQAPKIQEIETRDQFGRVQKIPATYNPQTRRYEPLQLGGGQAPTGAPAAGAMPAQAVAPPQSTPAAPAAAQAPAGPMLGGDGLVTQSLGEVGASGIPRPSATQPAAQAPEQTASGYRELSVNLNTLPKPQEGFVYDLGPNGLPQFDAQMNPKMIPQKELETRATLEVKRGEAEQEAEQQKSGVANIISTARNMVAQPGFDEALRLGRADIGSIPLPYSGGEGFSPAQGGYAIARATNPDAPVWGVMDDIAATQSRLKAVVARPLFKGQGQVSDSERRMITEMIGSLSKASSRADYQFRLNSVERMIDDMHAGKMKAADAYSARPTTEELKGIYGLPDEAAISRKVADLAKKYNVPIDDMSQYVISQFQYVNGAR